MEARRLRLTGATRHCDGAWRLLACGMAVAWWFAEDHVDLGRRPNKLAPVAYARRDRLSEQDIASIGGRRHQLVAFLRLRYELDALEATSQADAFVRALQVLCL